KIRKNPELAIGNRVEAYTGDRAGNFRRMARGNVGMPACGGLFANNYTHLDGQAGEIAEVGHFRVGGVPKFGFDRLKLREDGSAVWIVPRYPIGRLKIRSVVGVLVGIVTIDYFLLP